VKNVVGAAAAAAAGAGAAAASRKVKEAKARRVVVGTSKPKSRGVVSRVVDQVKDAASNVAHAVQDRIPGGSGSSSGGYGSGTGSSGSYGSGGYGGGSSKTGGGYETE
jgi:hypothetical protein